MQRGQLWVGGGWVAVILGRRWAFILFSMLGESDSFQKDPVIKKAKQDSNFRAIKNLLEAEDSIRVAQNRIRVLHLIEEKNSHKLLNQVGLIEKIQQVRHSTSAHHLFLQNTRQQLAQEAEEARSHYAQVNSQHREKLRQALEDVHRSRKWQYLTMEQESQAADRHINASKRSLQEEKSQLRERVAGEQEKAKHSLIRFHEGRQSRIREVKVSEVAAIKAKEAARQKELRDLSNVEMQLVQKQSASQAAYLQVKQKLDALLTNANLQSSLGKPVLSKKSLKSSLLLGRENRIDA